MTMLRFRIRTLMIAVAVIGLYAASWAIDEWLGLLATGIACWGSMALVFVSAFYREGNRRIAPAFRKHAEPSTLEIMRLALVAAAVTFFPAALMSFLFICVLVVLVSSIAGW